MYRKLLSLCLALCILASCATAAVAEPAVAYTGTAVGFGGDVVVTLALDGAGAIASVGVVGDGETPGIGGAAIETYNAQTLPTLVGQAATDVSADALDAVAGATMTSNAVRLALANALDAANGIGQSALNIPDGAYHGQAQGFALGKKVGVTVQVEDNWVASIRYDENAETAAIWNYAVQVGESLIAAKSLAVDAIAGATVSSNAIKSAVADALVNQAGAAASALYAPVPKSDARVTLGSPEAPYNVLVVGFGGSGATAALSASEHTDKVIAIEMNAKVGGNTSTASGPMGVNPPSKVKTNGGLDFEDADGLLADWLAYTIDSNGEQDANPEIVENLIRNGGSVNDWLERNGFPLGAPTSFLTRFVVSQGFSDYSLDHLAVQKHFEDMADTFTANGGELMLNTKGDGYLFDEAGKLAGVTAQGADGTRYDIYARSVIIATGGFGGSAQMMEKYLGGAYNVYGMTNCDGVMIQAAIDAGADTQNIAMPPMSHFSAPATILTSFEDVPYTAPGLEGSYSPNDILDAILLGGRGMNVTAEGERFYNEANVDMESWIAGANFYTIINQALVDDMKANGLPSRFSTILTFRNQGAIEAGEPLTMIEEVLEAGSKVGEVVKADTIEALADALGMDAARLQNTLSVYNGYCAQGEDPDYGKDAALLCDLSEGPYYAVKGAAWIYSTVGGLKVDAQMRVIDTQNAPIDGLYAVGTDSMGVLMSEEKFYLGYGGVAMGYVFYSGHEAGQCAARYAEGFEAEDVTDAFLEAVTASPSLSSLPYAAGIDAGLTVEKIGLNKYELTGTAANLSALASDLGIATTASNFVALRLDAPGDDACAKVSCALPDGSVLPCFYEEIPGGVVCVQPVDASVLTAGGFTLTAAWDSGEVAYQFCAGTLSLSDLDGSLAAAAAQAQALPLYAVGDFAYVLEAGGDASSLYLQSPAPATIFDSAVIARICVDGVETLVDQRVENPGAYVTCPANVNGAKEITAVVDWNFSVPKLDIWTMTTTSVPYTNTVNYTFSVR